MPTPAYLRFWPLVRRLFRWFRICCLLVVLAAVVLVIYLNQVGLPDFIKNPLLAEIRDRGIELQFDRMRLHWYRGIVAEKVNLGRARERFAPQLFIEEVTVKLNEPALRDFRLEVDSLHLRGGRLVWALVVSNEPPYRLALDDIQSEVRFPPHEQLELAQFQARCLGIKFKAAGTITNAPYLRQWQRRRASGAPPSSPLWPRQLRQLAQTMEKIHFTATPEMFLTLHLDARDTNQFAADFRLQAAGARTPWGAVDNVLLVMPVRSLPDRPGWMQTELKLRCDQATTHWGEAKQTRLNLLFVQALTNPMPASADLELNLRQPKSRWASARSLALTTRTTQDTRVAAALHTGLKLNMQGFTSLWGGAPSATLSGTIEHSTTNAIPARTHLLLTATAPTLKWGKADTLALEARTTQAATNWLPLAVDSTLKLTGPDTKWGRASSLNLASHFAQATSTRGRQAEAGWAWWAKLEPYLFDWRAQLTGVETPKVGFKDLSLSGQWRAPRLELNQVEAALFDGRVKASGSLEVGTREVRLAGSTDFDPHRIAPWLSESDRRWLNQFAWEQAPRIQVSAGGVLPATIWTNAHPDWRGEVLPQLKLAGHIETGQGSFRDIPFLAGQSDLTLTNVLLRLPNLRIDRPEGSATLEYSSDLFTQDYHWRFDSRIDPKAIRSLLEGEAERKALDNFEFRQTPALKGELWGRWRAIERTGGHALLTLTNFSFRGVAVSNFTAGVRYTNRVIQATNVVLENGPQKLTVAGIGVDIPADRIYITNGQSTVDPFLVTDMIGPKTSEAIKPYRFIRPPTASVYGSLPLADEERTDLHFEIDGGPFQYWKFNLPQIRGTVHWVTNTLTLTNVQSRFYGGELRGDAWFNFAPKVGTDFQFRAHVTNAALHTFMSDMSSPTNQLDGVWNGTLHVTSANSSDWESWQGQGAVQLHDGFLWDIPLVGIFSPVLNAVAPGLGKSRVSRGMATYSITNSIIHTRDLELRAPAMRLQYDGTVDFDGNVKARVQAELLRDAWLVGPLMRLALMPITKLFEYKVTGTLSEPKKSPLYIPKLFLMPFQPFRTLKDLFNSTPPNGKPLEPPASPKPENR